MHAYGVAYGPTARPNYDTDENLILLLVTKNGSKLNSVAQISWHLEVLIFRHFEASWNKDNRKDRVIIFHNGIFTYTKESINRMIFWR